jgi:hypothetical protein
VKDVHNYRNTGPMISAISLLGILKIKIVLMLLTAVMTGAILADVRTSQNPCMHKENP